MKVNVYGASDDLIEVDGDIEAEFSYSEDESNFLVFSDGTVLSVAYDDSGMWRIGRIFAGSASFAKTEASDPDDDYSDKVCLTGDIRFVALCREMVRKDKTVNECAP